MDVLHACGVWCVHAYIMPSFAAYRQWHELKKIQNVLQLVVIDLAKHSLIGSSQASFPGHQL